MTLIQTTPKNRLEWLQLAHGRPSIQKSPSPAIESLEQAIDAAPISELRAILKALAHAQPAANKFVTKQLLTPIAGSESRKRKAIETCARCKEDYRVAENTERCCVFHPDECSDLRDSDGPEAYKNAGEKQLDDTDVWGDEFGPLPGPDDSDTDCWYKWSCCGAENDEPGCAVGSHVPMTLEAKHRRRRTAEQAPRWEDGY